MLCMVIFIESRPYFFKTRYRGDCRSNEKIAYITGRGRQKDRVRARDFFSYWTVVELGMTMVDLARKFDPNVGKVENASDSRRPRVTL